MSTRQTDQISEISRQTDSESSVGLVGLLTTLTEPPEKKPPPFQASVSRFWGRGGGKKNFFWRYKLPEPAKACMCVGVWLIKRLDKTANLQRITLIYPFLQSFSLWSDDCCQKTAIVLSNNNRHDIVDLFWRWWALSFFRAKGGGDEWWTTKEEDDDNKSRACCNGLKNEKWKEKMKKDEKWGRRIQKVGRRGCIFERLQNKIHRFHML